MNPAQASVSKLSRPTWAEIDLSATAYNVRRVEQIVGPRVGVMAVVKAEAYGHGALEVARTALKSGATCLGVAALNEAIALRQAGLTAPIVVLGWTPGWLARQALAHDIACAVFDLDTAGEFSRAAQELGHMARVHVKINTGMNRLGLLPDEAIGVVRQLAQLEGLSLEGIFTHFARADEADPTYTYRQIESFKQVLNDLETSGITFSIRHAANSPGILRFPESHFDLVRLGVAMHGLDPSDDAPLPSDFKPALTLKTLIAQVKTFPPGSPVSYGGTHITQGYARIAVLPIGYADGFRRKPNNWGEVLAHGRRAPIVGRVCMDQCMIDVTHIPDATQGDEVVLIGAQREDRIRAEAVAVKLGTNNYETVSMIMGRVPRVYLSAES
ncbi:MAG TPA: alanine racemase [Anaerolineae bacterium]|nr:alanine racemase [Anaerolineae bacterium]